VWSIYDYFRIWSGSLFPIGPSGIIMDSMSFTSGIYFLVVPEKAKSSTIFLFYIWSTLLMVPAIVFHLSTSMLIWPGHSGGVPSESSWRHLEMLELDGDDNDSLFPFLSSSIYSNYFLVLSDVWIHFSGGTAGTMAIEVRSP